VRVYRRATEPVDPARDFRVLSVRLGGSRADRVVSPWGHGSEAVMWSRPLACGPCAGRRVTLSGSTEHPNRHRSPSTNLSGASTVVWIRLHEQSAPVLGRVPGPGIGVFGGFREAVVSRVLFRTASRSTGRASALVAAVRRLRRAGGGPNHRSSRVSG